MATLCSTSWNRLPKCASFVSIDWPQGISEKAMRSRRYAHSHSHSHVRPVQASRSQSEGPSDSSDPSPSSNRLTAVLRRKQQEVATRLKDMGDDALEERLRGATQVQAPEPYRLSRLIAEIVPTGRPVLVFEVARNLTSKEVPSSSGPAELTKRLLAAGGDAFVVPTDLDDTPEGLKDLFSVLNAVAGQAPVLQRDWFLHPLQIVDAKEAGAAGVVGVIASVAGERGTPVLSSFAAALGLDCPVEIVNLKELKAMEAMGVPFYGMNISVGLTVTIAGFGADVTHGLLGELPFGAASMAGVKSIDEARAAKISGADAVLIKKELLLQWEGKEAELVERLRDATCGDD